jgi:hypothetical protein
MRHYSITGYRWNGFRDVQTGRFGVIACSTGHALEEAIRLCGPSHYTALEIPATPDPTEVHSGAYYSWHITRVGKQHLRSPYVFDA